MSTTKWTPGPWHHGFFRNPGADPRFAGCDIAADGGTNIGLAYFQRDEHTPEECKANARLIAAAPELYEALAAVVKAADDYPFSHTSFVVHPWMRAALAKARGEA